MQPAARRLVWTRCLLARSGKVWQQTFCARLRTGGDRTPCQLSFWRCTQPCHGAAATEGCQP